MGEVEARLVRHIETVSAGPDRDELIKLTVYHYMEQRRYAILKTMVLSAMALEALINNVAKQKLPRFDREALDKLDIAAKWVLIPRLAFGNGIDPGSDLIARIADIQKERNFLVHAKPVHVECDSISRVRPLSVDRAEKAWKTCVDAVAALRSLAPEFERNYFETEMPDREAIRQRKLCASIFERQTEVDILGSSLRE